MIAADDEGRSILHLMSLFDRPTLYDVLLQHVHQGALKTALNIKSLSCMLPIHWAAQCSPVLFSQMFDPGVNHTELSDDGRTVVHFAAQNFMHSLKPLRLLFEAGFNMNCCSHDDSTAVHDCVSAAVGTREQSAVGDLLTEAMTFLKEAGLDLTQARHDGMTALHLVCDKLTSLPKKVFVACLDTISYLLKNGLNPFAKMNDKRTALCLILQSFEKGAKRTGVKAVKIAHERS